MIGSVSFCDPFCQLILLANIGIIWKEALHGENRKRIGSPLATNVRLLHLFGSRRWSTWSSRALWPPSSLHCRSFISLTISQNFAVQNWFAFVFFSDRFEFLLFKRRTAFFLPDCWRSPESSFKLLGQVVWKHTFCQEYRLTLDQVDRSVLSVKDFFLYVDI